MGILFQSPNVGPLQLEILEFFYNISSVLLATFFSLVIFRKFFLLFNEIASQAEF